MLIYIDVYASHLIKTKQAFSVPHQTHKINNKHKLEIHPPQNKQKLQYTLSLPNVSE
jgi:hypothetical protein